jgi:hypothetical protein
LHSQRLSRSQIRALEDLEDATEGMERWHGKTHTELENNEEFLLAYRDWERQMIRAIRAGLTGNPNVQEFIRTRRAFGSRKLLRRARSGVESGIGQFTSDEILLRGEITKLIREYEKRYQKRLTQSRARQLLIVNGTLPQMTRQGFHKLLTKLFLLGYFRR